jgi:hypothetical protein
MIGIQSALQIGMSMQNGNTTKGGVMRWLLFVMTAPTSISRK